MKKPFIYTLILAATLSVPMAAHAQLTALFPFGQSAKNAPEATPAPAATVSSSEDAAAPDTSTADETIDLETLKSKPLPERRKIVASELNSILGKLNTLYDKTKIAADRLTDNGIVTDTAQTSLGQAALTLANARLSIDALTAAANDPANESVTALMVGTSPFKDAVIAVETNLRDAREQILASLLALKAAVSAAVTAQ